MSEQINGGQEPQPNAVKPIWEAMTSTTDTVIQATPAQQIDPQTKDTVAETVIEPPVVETPKVETPPASVEPVAPKTDEPIIELSVSDAAIKDVSEKYEEGSYQKIAYDVLGVDLTENSLDALKNTFKDSYVPKTEVDKIASANKEKYFSTLDPKVAAALELKDLGVPDEYLLNPTQMHDQLLGLDDASLVREALAGQQGWDEAMVDAEMEELSASPEKLSHKAKVARINLSNERQEILNTQSQLVQKYTEQKQQAIVQQKTEADNRFKEALNNESAFLGVPLSKEVKASIEAKYSKGLYDSALSDAQAKVRAILQLEYGDKFSKVALSKAKEEGKAEIVSKLSDAPSLKSGGGAIVNVPNQDGEKKSPFANMPNPYGA